MSEIKSAMSTAPDSDARIDIACRDLDATITFYTQVLGFRLDMIMPADSPRVAVVSGYGIVVRLAVTRERPASAEKTTCEQEPLLAICRSDDDSAWVEGRAGMQYRDLVPGRHDGRVIASHIRILTGGPVPDYVHYHHVGFQMIYCRRGWVRVVYEDQGPAFLMRAGDCVLQPPAIRHRVLESSPGLEVIEVGCPAEHETRRDHDLALPTPRRRPDRDFAGQRFVRHVAATARWLPSGDGRFEYRDTGIGAATAGLADARILRHGRTAAGARRPSAPARAASRSPAFIANDRPVLLVVLAGRLQLDAAALGLHLLECDDSCLVAAGTGHGLHADGDCEVLRVVLPAPA